MLQLNTIKAQPGATHRVKRLGRGAGSGRGGTAGKGHKGQLARSGGRVRPGFEGGQMPLYRRIPKRGFTNPTKRAIAIINLGALKPLIESGVSEVSLATLLESKLIKGAFDRLHVLGNGEIGTKVKVLAHKVSEGAKQKIEKAGGVIELLPIPAAQPRDKKRK